MRRLPQSLLLVWLVASSGCATVFAGPSHTISVNSNPSGADVLVGGAIYGRTPTVITLSKSDPRPVSVSAPGYQMQNCFLSRQIGAGWVVLDIIFFFPISLIVDALTGAWNTMEPPYCTANLQPAQPAPGYPPAYPQGYPPQYPGSPPQYPGSPPPPGPPTYVPPPPPPTP